MVLTVVLILVLWVESLWAMLPDLASFPLPDDMQMKMVAVDAIHNGVVLSMATIESGSPLSESVEFYRHTWSDPVSEGLPGFVELELNHWMVISRLNQGVNTVIQLDTTQPERTVGYVSQRRLAEALIVPDDTLFADLQRLSSTQSRDGSQLSVLTVYASHASVKATVQRTGRRLFDKGWSIVAMSEQTDATSIAFTQDKDRLEIVISSSQEFPSLVVVNRVMIQ